MQTALKTAFSSSEMCVHSGVATSIPSSRDLAPRLVGQSRPRLRRSDECGTRERCEDHKQWNACRPRWRPLALKAAANVGRRRAHRRLFLVHSWSLIMLVICGRGQGAAGAARLSPRTHDGGYVHAVAVRSWGRDGDRSAAHSTGVATGRQDK